MEKVFEHQKVEREIYRAWEESGAFKSTEHGTRNTLHERKPYTILMPPPNANASLHAGHGMYTVDDILIRWKRMQGYAATWIPGRDHAGFETQFVYEKHLAKEGKSRLDFDRATLYQNVAQFVEDNSGLIFEQFRRLGFSADWSRSVFTLDPQVIDAVYTTFTKMVKDGLVYRSNYLVQYCPHCGTSLAELEIKHLEREDKLYYVKYAVISDQFAGEFLTVATVRPETMFGDTALAVNPKDARYTKYIGTTVRLPLTTRQIPVIADPMVDMEFGTGVVKITPAHDSADWETGIRHKLPVINVISQQGRVVLPPDVLNDDSIQKIDGMKVKAAREATVAELTRTGTMERIDEHYNHSVTVCYKCSRDMEPMTVPNWYIKVKPLKQAVVDAVKTKKTQLTPKKYERQLLDWMEIMHDWPISRQIAWGIRIPAWYPVGVQHAANSIQQNAKIFVTFLAKSQSSEHLPKNAQGSELVNKPVAISGYIGDLLKTYSLEEIETGLQTLSAPTEATYVVSATKPGEGYLQETDTFDTWFSSGQWPLVTLKEEEYATRYPTDVMATMSDILKFWVSRMMMFGLYIRGEVPFRHVYLWSTVTDAKGQKMSKSKGNVINPIDLVDKYGADAFRMSLLFGNGEGGKIPLSDDKVRAMRNFGNKLWNMARFFLMMQERSGLQLTAYSEQQLHKEDEKILKELNVIVGKMTNLLERFRFSEAADTIYEFMWHTVADVYIEQVKDREDQEVALSVLCHVLLTGLKLLHPFMPFVTEAIWKELNPEAEMLIVSAWPSI
jgi:valyl-tRNA synthetase